MTVNSRQSVLSGVLVSQTIQQGLVGIMGLAFSVGIFSQSKLSPEQVVQKLQFILIAYAIGTLLQAWRNRFLGSGLFLPPLSGAIYVQPSILALTMGGVPLLMGMTIFAGICEFILSYTMQRTRFLFPPEICGLVLLLVGLSLGVSGFTVGVTSPYNVSLSIFIATLLPILVLSVWGKGYVRHISSLIGVLVGVASALLLKQADTAPSAIAQSVSWFGFPDFSALFDHHITFSWALMPLFFLIGLSATLRTIGLTIGMQQANNPKWKKPDQPVVRRAIRTDSVVAVLAGLFGINGLNISPTATTLAIATRFAKLSLSVSISILFLVVACVPKLLYFISVAPLSIVGAVLFYYAAFIFTGGVRTIGVQAFGIRQVFSIGIPFCLAISSVIAPDVFAKLPYPFDAFGRSSITAGLMSAIILNLFFHIGTMRSASFTIAIGAKTYKKKVRRQMYNYGQAWHLKDDLIEDSINIASEVIAQIIHAGLVEGPIKVAVKNSTSTFELAIQYRGTSYPMMPLTRVDTTMHLDEEVFIAGLKIYLRGTMPEEVISARDGNQCALTLRFLYS